VTQALARVRKAARQRKKEKFTALFHHLGLDLLREAALEDKIVQRATVAVLNFIYEGEFLGFSYGLRPKRGQHDALDALAVGITDKKVNFILDADVRSFFDEVSERWLIRLVEHRRQSSASSPIAQMARPR